MGSPENHPKSTGQCQPNGPGLVSDPETFDLKSLTSEGDEDGCPESPTKRPGDGSVEAPSEAHGEPGAGDRSVGFVAEALATDRAQRWKEAAERESRRQLGSDDARTLSEGASEQPDVHVSPRVV